MLFGNDLGTAVNTVGGAEAWGSFTAMRGGASELCARELSYTRHTTKGLGQGG